MPITEFSHMDSAYLSHRLEMYEHYEHYHHVQPVEITSKTVKYVPEKSVFISGERYDHFSSCSRDRDDHIGHSGFQFIKEPIKDSTLVYYVYSVQMNNDNTLLSMYRNKKNLASLAENCFNKDDFIRNFPCCNDGGFKIVTTFSKRRNCINHHSFLRVNFSKLSSYCGDGWFDANCNNDRLGGLFDDFIDDVYVCSSENGNTDSLDLYYSPPSFHIVVELSKNAEYKPAFTPQMQRLSFR